MLFPLASRTSSTIAKLAKGVFLVPASQYLTDQMPVCTWALSGNHDSALSQGLLVPLSGFQGFSFGL